MTQIVDYIVEYLRDKKYETEEYALKVDHRFFYNPQPFLKKGIELFITKDCYDNFFSAKVVFNVEKGYIIIADKEFIINEIIEKNAK